MEQLIEELAGLIQEKCKSQKARYNPSDVNDITRLTEALAKLIEAKNNSLTESIKTVANIIAKIMPENVEIKVGYGE